MQKTFKILLKFKFLVLTALTVLVIYYKKLSNKDFHIQILEIKSF